MKYRVYAEKPAFSFCITGQNVFMAMWYAFKFVRWGMLVKVERYNRP